MADTEAQCGGTKQVAFLAVLVLVVALGIAGYVLMNKKTVPKIVTTGSMAPDFRLQSLDGKTVSLSDLRGRIVMVHFWATWCPPCVEEIPTLAGFNNMLSGTDFAMLAISVDEGGPGVVTEFLRQNRLVLPVLHDPGRAVANSYGTFKFPETYIVDRQGKVRFKIIGSRNWLDPEALRGIQQLLAEK